ncbi:hypothetical protein ACLX1H_000729 [Fusarium chlamydosporum]
MQQHSGLLISEWPAIIGSDFAGVVVEVGPDTSRLKVGDYVCGVALLGRNRFAPFQQNFLVQEEIVLKKSPNVALEDSCTIGAGLLTSSLCLLAGLGLDLPRTAKKAPEKDEWVVILGGTGSVGQYAVQIAHKNGASATFNNRATLNEQVADIQRITGGNFGKIMDATAYGYEVMTKALETASVAETKLMATVDDWSDIPAHASIRLYKAELGHLYLLDEEIGAQVTADISRWIPYIEAHLDAETLKPIEHQLVPGIGWEKVIKGIHDLEAGKAEKKIV